MNKLEQYEIDALVDKYSKDVNPSIIRIAVLHTQEVLADKNPERNGEKNDRTGGMGRVG